MFLMAVVVMTEIIMKAIRVTVVEVSSGATFTQEMKAITSMAPANVLATTAID